MRSNAHSYRNIAHYMPHNSERRKRQKAQDIRVIVGNPPYSAGQRSQNDNAANVPYPYLDERIRNTYAARSKQTSVKNLYDTYIRAIRWGSDQLQESGSGVMAYVTNAGWLDASAMDGMRKCLASEFNKIYIFHLRGNQRTSGEVSRCEGEKVFGSGSRAPIAITILVKNPDCLVDEEIKFHDVGDHLSREQKLSVVKEFGNISGIGEKKNWITIFPNEHEDWINQRDRRFHKFIPLGEKKDKSVLKLFENYSLGVVTNRDAWCYNASRTSVEKSIRRLIGVYNEHLSKRPQEGYSDRIENHIATDKTKISWTRGLKSDLGKGKSLSFRKEAIVPSIYRPFFGNYLYFDRRLNEVVSLMPRLFPTGVEVNRVICVTGMGARVGAFSCLMVDALYDLNGMEAGAQSFPLWLFEPADVAPGEERGLLADTDTPNGWRIRDGITDVGLEHFRAAYPGEAIDKEDIFYYVYGLLHSKDYRTRFANNLSKELPRTPRVKTVDDFRAFRDAGRRLGDLHVNYEAVDPWPATIKEGDLRLAAIGNPEAFYRVTKMKFGGTARDKDKSTMIYNPNITVQGIPLEAYDYVVNGKPALEWVMDRQVVKTDKASGIVNDANRYAIETVGNPAYPLELFQRIITVSLETMKIVRAFPNLELLE